MARRTKRRMGFNNGLRRIIDAAIRKISTRFVERLNEAFARAIRKFG